MAAILKGPPSGAMLIDWRGARGEVNEHGPMPGVLWLQSSLTGLPAW